MKSLTVGKGTDLAEIIQKPLQYLRDNGITVTTSAAHGDSDCYEGRFVNWQVWTDFPKMNTMQADYQQQSMKKFGLSVEAYQRRWDWYLSDSGGRFTHPPLQYLESWSRRGVVPIQILIHSQWWK